MSLRYRANDGTETIVSGLTPGGDIEYGAVATRTGRVPFTGTIAAGTSVAVNVTFDTPMPDDDYLIEFEIDDMIGAGIVAYHGSGMKSASGFRVGIRNTTENDKPMDPVYVKYTAYKLYTVQHAAQNAEDIATIKAAMPSSASSTNKLATSNDVITLATDTDSRLDDLEDLVPTGASVSNQLATKSYVDTEVATKQDPLTFDTVPTAGSSNPVTSDGIKTALDNKQTVLTFDNTPTTGSTNPVTSEGIKAALDNKQNALTFDNAPTSGSSNPVTSGGVYNALSGIAAPINTSFTITNSWTANTWLSSGIKLPGGVYLITVEGPLQIVTTNNPVDTIYYVTLTGIYGFSYGSTNGQVGPYAIPTSVAAHHARDVSNLSGCTLGLKQLQGSDGGKNVLYIKFPFGTNMTNLEFKVTYRRLI